MKLIKILLRSVIDKNDDTEEQILSKLEDGGQSREIATNSGIIVDTNVDDYGKISLAF